jgi:beta-glucanase (GH16 family)
MSLRSTCVSVRLSLALMAALCCVAGRPAAAQSFFDGLDGQTSLFSKADGWTNGSMFNCGWRADHVTFSGGLMTLTLDNVGCPSGCSSRPYASGEYRTNALYGYGRVEARFKAARGSGTVAATLFTYTGSPWDEIDIEILGKNTTQMQTNYFTNGVGGKEVLINLGFDAAAGFHTYAFEWSATAIRWYVDGVLVHTENGSKGPLPTHPGQIMVNMWPGIGVDGWLGPFTYTGPLQAQYDYISFTPAGAATPTAPPRATATTAPRATATSTAAPRATATATSRARATATATARARATATATATPSGGQTIANGTYRIVARHSGKALDSAGTGDGANVQQWAYAGTNNQRWTVTHLGSGQYQIQNVAANKALDAAGAGANGTNVQIWTYGGGNNQRWTITATSGGYYRLSPVHAPSHALDVSGISTADGANVHLWSYLGQNNQQWAFLAP